VIKLIKGEVVINWAIRYWARWSSSEILHESTEVVSLYSCKTAFYGQGMTAFKHLLRLKLNCYKVQDRPLYVCSGHGCRHHQLLFIVEKVSGNRSDELAMSIVPEAYVSGLS
jgi:hypothetical protein